VIQVPAQSSVGHLVREAKRRHAGLDKVSPGMRFALNEELAGGEERLAEGDTVAFLPPVAGG